MRFITIERAIYLRNLLNCTDTFAFLAYFFPRPLVTKVVKRELIPQTFGFFPPFFSQLPTKRKRRKRRCGMGAAAAAAAAGKKAYSENTNADSFAVKYSCAKRNTRRS